MSWWNPLDWWADVQPGNTQNLAKDSVAAVGGPVGALTDWLASWAGKLAQGVEAGLVSLLGDVWDVIVGPVLVIVGLVIMLLVLAWANKNQLIQVAAVAAKAAA